MSKPIILTLDDEPSVLNAIERDLVHHYHGDYRIVKAGSGVDALRAVKQFKRRDPYLLETSVPGIFAAGDVRQGAVRRVASAVGQGANVINFVHQYLRTV